MKKVLLFLADGFEECEGLNRGRYSAPGGNIGDNGVHHGTGAGRLLPPDKDCGRCAGGTGGSGAVRCSRSAWRYSRHAESEGVSFGNGHLPQLFQVRENWWQRSALRPVFSVHWVCCRENGRRYIPAWRIRWPERSMPLVRWWWTET